MTKIIAKMDFIANGVKYLQGDEIKDLTIEQIIKLNDQRLIEPLTYRDIVLIERELKQKKEEK